MVTVGATGNHVSFVVRAKVHIWDNVINLEGICTTVGADIFIASKHIKPQRLVFMAAALSVSRPAVTKFGHDSTFLGNDYLGGRIAAFRRLLPLL